MPQIHLFSGLGSSLLPGLRSGTLTLEKMIDKLNYADAKHHIWNDWKAVAASIEPNGGPVILIGHSNGVLACASVAKALQDRKIKVAYVGAIDPTAARFPAFGNNVQRVDEFWASSGFPHAARGCPTLGQGKCLFDQDFAGKHQLFHVRGSHIGVVSDEQLQATIVESVKTVVRN